MNSAPFFGLSEPAVTLSSLWSGNVWNIDKVADKKVLDKEVCKAGSFFVRFCSDSKDSNKIYVLVLMQSSGGITKFKFSLPNVGTSEILDISSSKIFSTPDSFFEAIRIYKELQSLSEVSAALRGAKSVNILNHASSSSRALPEAVSSSLPPVRDHFACSPVLALGGAELHRFYDERPRYKHAQVWPPLGVAGWATTAEGGDSSTRAAEKGPAFYEYWLLPSDLESGGLNHLSPSFMKSHVA
jgi:hypothetical protein